MPELEKGEPHGAATLLRVPVGATDRAEAAQLRISWAVFLPISDASDIDIPVDGSAVGRFHLLLHGYFFLDSGRRRIEGLEPPLRQGSPPTLLRCVVLGTPSFANCGAAAPAEFPERHAQFRDGDISGTRAARLGDRAT